MFGIYCYGCPSIFPNEVGIYVFDSFSEKPSLNSNNDVFFFEIFRRVKKKTYFSFFLFLILAEKVPSFKFGVDICDYLLLHASDDCKYCP